MNKIFPFLWLHGEDKEQIIAEIDAIYNLGLKSFCIESRPHPDFCGDRWWEDLSIILSYAKQKNMTVWILDDKKFPTGFANGAILKDKSKCQKHIALRFVDVIGQMNNKVFIDKKDDGDILLSSFAIPIKDDFLDFNKIISLEKFDDNFIYFDLEKKLYRICSIFQTTCSSYVPNYIDMLNSESTDCLINEVYEKHYEHFKAYFGNVIEGFFSDEPCFGNWYNDLNCEIKDIYSCGLRNPNITYPFSNEVKNIIKTEKDYLSLFFDIDNEGREFRCKYMDLITTLYSNNFSKKIGLWCSKHNVKYIGHIIEDMNAHVHTGCSSGHYFRSQQGQDMAGIDVVLHQIKPYNTTFNTKSAISGGISDPKFFIYTLPTLASSCAFFDNYKKGNSFCEIFGAYGYSENILDMKYLVDIMLVNGINHFVPHAFSPKNDDIDCPPHFNKGGLNPQLKPLKKLFSYIDIISKIFCDGKQCVENAILYHAEADWSVDNYCKVDDVLYCLKRKQINALICPTEYLDLLSVKGVKNLIIPYSEYLPSSLISKINSLIDVNCIWLKKDNFDALDSINTSIKLSNKNQDIMYYHYIKNNQNLFLFFNSGLSDYCGKVYCDFKGNLQIYNFANETKRIEVCDNCFHLTIKSGECLFISPTIESIEKIKIREKTIETIFDVYLKEYNKNEYFFYKKLDKKEDINGKDNLPNFVGFVKYITEIEILNEKEFIIEFNGDLGYIDFKLNDKNIGLVIGNSYIFNVTLKQGKNKIEIETSNTLGNIEKDDLSKYSGLQGISLDNNIKIKEL